MGEEALEEIFKIRILGKSTGAYSPTFWSLRGMRERICEEMEQKGRLYQ